MRFASNSSFFFKQGYASDFTAMSRIIYGMRKGDPTNSDVRLDLQEERVLAVRQRSPSTIPHSTPPLSLAARSHGRSSRSPSCSRSLPSRCSRPQPLRQTARSYRSCGHRGRRTRRTTTETAPRSCPSRRRRTRWRRTSAGGPPATAG